MGGSVFYGNFADLSSALQITAQTAPTQMAGIVGNDLISLIVWCLTLFSNVMVCFFVAKFLAGVLISGIPFIKRFVGGDGSGGTLEYIKQNWANALVGLVCAVIATTGACWSITGTFVQDIPQIAEAATNAVNYAKNTPESISRFKQLIATTNNQNKLAQDYQVFLNQEQQQEDALANYVKVNAPADNDPRYMQMKSNYTGTVCKCQIISQALNGYAQKQGQPDNTEYKQHLAGQTTNTSQSGAYNKAFIVPATEQAYGVSLPTGTTN